MSENIKWLEVVLDYGKRFSDVTFMDLFGLSNDYKISELELYIHDNDYKISELELYIHDNDYHFLCNKKPIKSYLSTSKTDGNGVLEYMDGTWEKVPEHILLRLLTEGKEDLV